MDSAIFFIDRSVDHGSGVADKGLVERLSGVVVEGVLCFGEGERVVEREFGGKEPARNVRGDEAQRQHLGPEPEIIRARTRA